MKTKLLVFLFAITMQFVNAQLNFTVLNKDGDPQQGVEVKLYGPDSWDDAVGSPFTTAANGIAVIPGLADGNYHYELFYTGTDGVEAQWGWGMDVAVAGATDFEITQNYPYYSGDNLSSLTPNVGSASSIDFTVKNDDIMESDVAVTIEVWISKDQVETDFHYIMPYEEAVAVPSLGEHTFNFDFTPAIDGEYFWKAIVRGNADEKIWNSFNWTSAFVVGDVDQLNFKVLNSEGNPQEGVEIKLFGPGSWLPAAGSPFTTGANGIAGIIGLADGNYNYELYYTETDGVESQWGWGENIVVVGTTAFEVTQNNPYHSGDNLSSLTLEAGVTSSIDFMVSNDDVNGYDNGALIEVWISETMSESDFHYTMTFGELVNIVNGTEHTFSFDFTPANNTEYFWKAIVWMGGTVETDSFDWTSAFTVGEVPPLNFEVLNGAGNPQENVEITFYQPGWEGPVVTYYTAANGIAEIPATSGNAVYQYEINYTGSDGLRHAWGWGDADFSGGNDFQVAQNYPFYSGDDLASLTFEVGVESTINVNVSNNAPGEDIWTAVEVWISKTENEADFHYTMDATQVIDSGTELSFPFNFTPTESGEHFWKAIVHYNNPVGTPTSDSFDWTSAFTVGPLNFEVLNGAGNPQENVEITFYQPGWEGPVVTYYTAANGIAEIPATSGNAVYQYEINYTGTDGIRNAWGWGNADFSAGNDFQVTQNYPFYSGDDISSLTFEVGVESTINFNVSNNAPGEDIWTAVEVWISKTENEADFHYTMDATEWVGTGTEVLFPFNFTPTESGDYFWKAIVHYNNPTGTPTSDSFDWTSAFTVGTLGVNDFSLNNTITVFPNPVMNNKVRFNLSTNDFIDGEVILYDLAGRVIVSKKINQNTGELNVVGVSEGFYFMKFINEDKIATQKVIIK